MTTAAIDPRYPTGKYEYTGSYSAEQRSQLIQKIAQAPAQLRAAAKGLSPQQLDTPYREGGWTLRQVVHHVPDSHMNAFIRFKLALTEDNPTIKPYREDLWAHLADVPNVPIETSLTLLDCVHERWLAVLRSMTDKDFQRLLQHPDMGSLTLDKTLGLYAWHGAHHVAHVTTLRKQKGW